MSREPTYVCAGWGGGQGSLGRSNNEALGIFREEEGEGAPEQQGRVGTVYREWTWGNRSCVGTALTLSERGDAVSPRARPWPR